MVGGEGGRGFLPKHKGGDAGAAAPPHHGTEGGGWALPGRWGGGGAVKWAVKPNGAVLFFRTVPL